MGKRGKRVMKGKPIQREGKASKSSLFCTSTSGLGYGLELELLMLYGSVAC
jgi:hypothetical protein